jgi:hypothetical protein
LKRVAPVPLEPAGKNACAQGVACQPADSRTRAPIFRALCFTVLTMLSMPDVRQSHSRKKGSRVERSRRSGPGSLRLSWGILVVVVVAAATLWILPGHKPNAVFGRLSYFQFWLAFILTAVAVLMLIVMCAPIASRRVTGMKMAAVWFGLILTSLAVEAVAFLWPMRRPMDNPWYLTNTGGVSASDDLPFARPPHLKWSGKSRGDLAQMNGDEDPYARTVSFETDMEGFRNSQDIRQADLIVIGDSYTEAGNIPETENFTSVTGRKLGVTVRNLGRSGYTTPDELIVLKNYGLACRPKIVVWQIAESNDLSDAFVHDEWIASGRRNFLDQAELGRTSRYRVWQQRSPSYRLFSLLRGRNGPEWPFAGVFKGRDGTETNVRFFFEDGMKNSAAGHPGWKTFSQALAEGAALCHANGIHLVVILMPIKYKEMGPYMQMPKGSPDYFAECAGLKQEFSTVLLPFCISLNVPFIDATTALKERTAAGDLVFQPFDTHLNSLGHEIVAGLVADFVKTMQWNGSVSNVVARP